MGHREGAGCLGDHGQRPVRRKDLFVFDDAAQWLARDQLHHQVRRSLLFAVVKDVGDAHMVQQRRVASLGTEALEEPGIARVLLFEHLDGDNPAKDKVLGLPDFSHPANRNTRGQLESPAEGDP
ncbi:hypothetical protein D9M72_466710 [compost metagenome]